MKEELEKEINGIVDDIIRTDFGLKGDRAGLGRLVSDLLAIRPDASPDESFVLKLQEKINQGAVNLTKTRSVLSDKAFSPERTAKDISEGRTQATAGQISTIGTKRGRLISPFLKLPYSYIFGSAAMTLAIVGAIFYISGGQTGSGAILTFPTDIQISAAPSRFEAFPSGDFSAAKTAASAPSGNESKELSLAAAPNAVAAGQMASPSGGLKNYYFTGILPDLPNTFPVLLAKSDSGGGVLNKLKVNGVDLSAFNNTSVETMLIKAGEYQVSLNFKKGEMSLYKIKDEEISGGAAISSDAEIIRIADEFLNQIGVEKASYGEPAIIRTASAAYPFAEILYPLTLNNYPVFRQGGERVGINIAVNAQTKSVVSLQGLSTLAFEAYPYEISATKEEIMRMFGNEEAKPVKTKLGAPLFSYLEIVRSRGEETERFLIPALAFPVKEPAAAVLANQSVVIPLITVD